MLCHLSGEILNSSRAASRMDMGCASLHRIVGLNVLLILCRPIKRLTEASNGFVLVIPLPALTCDNCKFTPVHVQSDDDNRPLASNWPCMAKARNLGQREKESMSCRISQEKRETRLQIIEGCRSTNEREA